MNGHRPSSYWNSRRVIVTGGAGFLGSYLVERLQALGCQDIHVPRSRTCDLTDRAAVRELIARVRPNTIIHAAAVVGGIGANRERPAEFFHANLTMGVNLIDEAHRAGVEKFVCLGTICAYPKFTPVPFVEENLWSGFPEETNAPYGIAKKALHTMLEAYATQYGMRGVYLLPVNLYGPRDNFDPASSHVIPALIRKFEEARLERAPEVPVWGTGRATREFLHARDAARGVLLAAEHMEEPLPVNLGAGFEISIRELAELIAKEVGYRGRLVWDESKPDGQPRRMLDTTRAERLFGFRAQIDFETGLRETIQWYREQRVATPQKVAV